MDLQDQTELSKILLNKDKVSSNEKIIYLEIYKIQVLKDQPRKIFNDDKILELSKSIKNVGILQPLIVKDNFNGTFTLLAGERRWRAAQFAEMQKVPCIIKNVKDSKSYEIALIENIQREDLNPIEEARAYEQLMSLTGMKASAIADKVGKDRTTITNLIRLLKLPEQILQLIEEGQIKAGQARPLLGLGDKAMMYQLAKKIVIQGWSARRVEDEIARITDPAGVKTKTGKKVAGRKDANVKALEEKIRKQYMAKVQVEHTRKGGGRISIHYGNLDDLDRILGLLGVKQ